MATEISVYMRDGRVFKYDVASTNKAREHAHRIINFGWRHHENGREEYYPVSQVLKVTFPMSEPDTLAEKYAVKKYLVKGRGE